MCVFLVCAPRCLVIGDSDSTLDADTIYCYIVRFFFVCAFPANEANFTVVNRLVQIEHLFCT